jgi:hypothetical protein
MNKKPFSTNMSKMGLFSLYKQALEGSLYGAPAQARFRKAIHNATLLR